MSYEIPGPYSKEHVAMIKNEVRKAERLVKWSMILFPCWYPFACDRLFFWENRLQECSLVEIMTGTFANPEDIPHNNG